jgi:DNA methylase
MDNRSHQEIDWDLELLGPELEELRELDFNLVYDPFLGSGTTLIAAELTGRVCLGIELDPKYVDVIVERWLHRRAGNARRPDVRAGQGREAGRRSMNRALPPRDRGNRKADSGWARKSAGAAARAFGLERRVAPA